MDARSSRKARTGGDQRLRRDPERIGGCNQIGLVRAQEVEHRAEQCRITEARAQGIGGKAGEREQSLGPRRIGEYPAERTERQCLGFGFDR